MNICQANKPLVQEISTLGKPSEKHSRTADSPLTAITSSLVSKNTGGLNCSIPKKEKRLKLLRIKQEIPQTLNSEFLKEPDIIINIKYVYLRGKTVRVASELFFCFAIFVHRHL